jgi:hypothetical protein
MLSTWPRSVMVEPRGSSFVRRSMTSRTALATEPRSELATPSSTSKVGEMS